MAKLKEWIGINNHWILFLLMTSDSSLFLSFYFILSLLPFPNPIFHHPPPPPPHPLSLSDYCVVELRQALTCQASMACHVRARHSNRRREQGGRPVMMVKLEHGFSPSLIFITFIVSDLYPSCSYQYEGWCNVRQCIECTFTTKF